MSIQSSIDLRMGSLEMGEEVRSAIADGHLEGARDVQFEHPFPDGSKVIVIPMVQTFNGANTPGLRISEVTNRGFKIRMNEVVIHTPEGETIKSDGIHKRENVGWMALRIE